MAALIGLGTLALMLLDRRNVIVTAEITAVVVLVVASTSRQDARHQPLLRLVDTIVGVGIGVTCKWAPHFVFQDSWGTGAMMGDDTAQIPFRGYHTG